MTAPSLCVWKTFLTICICSMATSAFGNASASVCNQTCICIGWSTPAGYYMEVRCVGDTGWTPGGSPPPSPVPGDGTWGGGGPPIHSSAPGPLLSGSLEPAVTEANYWATNYVKGDLMYDPELKWYYVPNNCSRLFYGSPFSQVGSDLLHSYIHYRYGQNATDPNNPSRIPCNEGLHAWTTCVHTTSTSASAIVS
jgi:hypothetical protein